jgi:hypothetical protein
MLCPLKLGYLGIAVATSNKNKIKIIPDNIPDKIVKRHCNALLI